MNGSTMGGDETEVRTFPTPTSTTHCTDCGRPLDLHYTLDQCYGCFYGTTDDGPDEHAALDERLWDAQHCTIHGCAFIWTGECPRCMDGPEPEEEDHPDGCDCGECTAIERHHQAWIASVGQHDDQRTEDDGVPF